MEGEDRGLIEIEHAQAQTQTQEHMKTQQHPHVQPQPQGQHQHSHQKKERFDVLSLLKKVKPVHVALFVAYLAIAMIMFAPITANMASTAPGTGGDTFLNLWGAWWVPYAIFTLHASIWNTSLLFWPVGASLVYQTMSPLGGLLVAPFQLISIPFAYNVLFFLGFALSGMTMYVLANYFTRNVYASAFAGLVYAFSAVHIALAVPHIDWINIEWIPLALYFFIRMIKEKNWYWDAIGLGISFVLITFMGDLEQSVMTLLLLAAVLVAYLIPKSTRALMLTPRFATLVAIAIVTALVAGSWGFVPIISSLLQPGTLSNANYLNDFPHNMLWSNDLLSFFLPSFYNGLYNGLAAGSYANAIYQPSPSERVSFIGYTVIALALFAIYKDRKRTYLWLGIAVIFAWISLGPYLQVYGNNTYIPGLYQVYHSVPGLNVIREPDRFDVIASVAFAMLAALGMQSLLDYFGAHEKHKKRKNLPLLIFGVIALIFLINNNGYPSTPLLQSLDYTNAHIPAIYSELSQLNGTFSVLNLPAISDPYAQFPQIYSGMATYYTTASHKPIVGGDATRTNTTQELSLYSIPLVVQSSNLQITGNASYQSPVLQNYTNQTLLALYGYNTAFVSVFYNAYSQSEAAQLEKLVSVFGQPVYYDNSTVVFETSNAIGRSLFKSYVASPSLQDWQLTQIYYQGETQDVWLPLNGGDITVYAPYANASSELPSQQYTSYINTTMSFYAITNLTVPVPLYVYAQTSSSGPELVGVVNVTRSLLQYKASMPLVSGPHGDVILFVPKASATALVAIKNITFSRG